MNTTMHAVTRSTLTIPPCAFEKATPTDDTDLAFVRELVTGSEPAWRTFHARYARLIYRCIVSVAGRFSPLLGGDDVHEIYASLLCDLLANDMKKLRSFDPARGKRLSSWIGLLATHAAYDYLRQQRRERDRASAADAEAVASDAPDPFDQVSARQRASLVRDVFAEFSAKDQQFIALYFADGLAPEEVATRMGISVKTVYSKKHKIRLRLEAILSQQRLAA